MNDVLQTVRDYFKRLATPKPGLSEDTARRSRYFNNLVISSFIGLTLFGIGLQIEPLINHGSFSPRVIPPISFLLGACVLSFFINKLLGRVVTASYIFLLSCAIVNLLYIYTTEDRYFLIDIRAISALLALPIIGAGILIGPRAPFVVAAFGITGVLIIGFARLTPDNPRDSQILYAINEMLTVVMFLMAVAVLSWYFELTIRGLVRQLQERNRELEESNERLAERRNMETSMSERISDLAGAVTAAFSAQTVGTNNQLSAVMQVTTTLEELNRTTEQIAKAAGQVATTAQDALVVAEQGNRDIKEGVQSLIELQDKVNKVSESIEGLYTQAREIDQIIELITEVAEETNLLALNATIEAAGAREYGRRFSAVANEVQRLANRSREAADRVRLMVNEVQEAIKTSTGVTKQGLRDAYQVAEYARKVDDTISGIFVMVQNTATLARQISFSIQQQKTASNQVLDTMRDISAVSQQVAESSHSLYSSMTELNSATYQLVRIETVEQEEPDFPILNGSN